MNQILLAVDTADEARARTLVGLLGERVGGIKVGLAYFCAHGPQGVKRIVGDYPLFLDLKLHDIPNTVALAVRSLLPLQPMFLTVHIEGGSAMLAAAVDAANEATRVGLKRPMLLGVTVLTSQPADVFEIERRAQEAFDRQLDGIICSPLEVRHVRNLFDPNFLIVTPGVRMRYGHGDQLRVATPRDALVDGADYVVIGREITDAADPLAAVKAITESIAS